LYQSKIKGTGAYQPEKILTNYDLEKLVETNHDWIVERTGIVKRHIAADNQASSDLAFEASKIALKDAELKASDIDLILFATVSPDQVLPATACFLQAKLEVPNIPALDIVAACSGFIYGLSIADQFIKTGMYKNILVVGTEVLSRYVSYKDRETCILFGDGAGAFVVSRAEKNEDNIIYSTHLKADGHLSDLLETKAGGSRLPLREEQLQNGDQWMKMKGREIFKHAVRTMSATCELALKSNNIQMSQVDWLIPHQANWRIMEAVADQFKFPKEKVISYVHDTGNTSAASIPLAFELAKKDGKIKRGQTILLTAFGAGLTSGSALFKY